MVVMVRWFSLRRLLFWSVLSSSILISLVWMGKKLRQQSAVRRRMTILASRKARAQIILPDSGKNTPKNPPLNASNVSKKDNQTLPSPPIGEKMLTSISGARELVIPPVTKLPILTAEFIRPFSMRYDDVKAEFKIYQESSPDEDMGVYLWRKFRVVALAQSAITISSEEKGRMPKAFYRFEKSIQRHVALFYGEYLLGGGTEPRHFGLPVCKTIGLGDQTDEYKTKPLSRLAGSQGTLSFKEIPYTVDGTFPPFTVNKKGNAQFIVKYFKVNRKDKSQTKDPNPSKGPNPDKGDQKKGRKSLDAAEKAKNEKDERAANRIFAREHYALGGTINHRGIIQPVCYEKQPALRMIYPYLVGGDLVTLNSDELRFYKPGQNPKTLLNPDETFLPRFFRQLVEAVYAVHQAGILHLDLKPENFVIAGPDRNFVLPYDSPALNQYSLVLLDFGLAMRLEDAKNEECIKAGTDVTMAPEQVMCNSKAGRGTDWWAVAASMWRTRVFWEPSIDDNQRDKILKSRCDHWGHYILPEQSFFSPEFTSLLRMMLKPKPEDRDFSRDSKNVKKLLDSPYLLRGLDPLAHQERLKELKNKSSTTEPSTESSIGSSIYYSGSYYSEA